jgi:hypothetical protein
MLRSRRKKREGSKVFRSRRTGSPNPNLYPPRRSIWYKKWAQKPETDGDHEDETRGGQRPKKRQKVVTEDVTAPEPEPEVAPAVEEVEEEDHALSPQDNVAKRKEPPTADSEDARPVKKSKATAKKAEKKQMAVEEHPPTPDVIIPGDVDFEVPIITEVRLSVDRESSAFATPEPASISSDPIADGLFEDDEDMYFAKLALARNSNGKFNIPSLVQWKKKNPILMRPRRSEFTPLGLLVPKGITRLPMPRNPPTSRNTPLRRRPQTKMPFPNRRACPGPCCHVVAFQPREREETRPGNRGDQPNATSHATISG